MQLRPIDVDGVGENVFVGASLDVTELEILKSLGQLVGVEDHLLRRFH